MAEQFVILGWAYFIGTELGEPFKIGKSFQIDFRLKMLQTGNPRKLVVLAAFETVSPDVAEGKLHLRFAADRLVGEWFAWSRAADEVIARISRGCAYTLRRHGGTGNVRVANRYYRFGKRWRP